MEARDIYCRYGHTYINTRQRILTPVTTPRIRHIHLLHNLSIVDSPHKIILTTDFKLLEHLIVEYTLIILIVLIILILLLKLLILADLIRDGGLLLGGQ